jgi:hypothetical protein
MSGLPPYVHALLALLGTSDEVPHLDDAGWKSLLAFADRTQCTLFLRGLTALPAWFAGEVELRYQRNASRRARLCEEFEAAAACLDRHAIPFVLLKSFTHETGFGFDGACRVQYDLDLLLQPDRVPAARAALIADLGYRRHGAADLSELHERPLIKPYSWNWRGDYFDPEMPVPVELHAKLWSETDEGIPASGLDEFWNRRVTLDVIPALSEPDRIALAALHVLRHILHNDVRPSHVYELASLLRSRHSDENLWRTWEDTHPAALRQLQSVAFAFARDWFDAPFPPAVERQWRSAPRAVHAWFQAYARSPLQNLIQPNKDAVWLQWALIPAFGERLKLMHRRLFPVRPPDPIEASNSKSYGAHVLRRFRYHAGAFTPALWSGVRLWWTALWSTSHTSDWKRSSV